jgi:hypothetical protein
MGFGELRRWVNAKLGVGELGRWVYEEMGSGEMGYWDNARMGWCQNEKSFINYLIRSVSTFS